ncbi:MAG: enhanced serine sensitivity protein SseB C-terminal domain-containing protein [Aeromicrobium sp.]
MTFPNNPLEVRLGEARTNDEPLGPWLRELQQATVFAPLRVTGESSSLGVVEVDGQQLALVFTSEEMLRSVTDVPFIAPPFAGLVDMLPPGFGVLVNPQSDVSITIAPADLEAGRAGGDPLVVDASRLFIGEPAEEPVDVLAALSRTAHGIAAVRELRRAWVSVDGAEPGLMVGVDLDPDNEDVRLVVTSALRDGLPADAVVELQFANDRGPVIDWMWANAEPFHAKS